MIPFVPFCNENSSQEHIIRHAVQSVAERAFPKKNDVTPKSTHIGEHALSLIKVRGGYKQEMRKASHVLKWSVVHYCFQFLVALFRENVLSSFQVRKRKNRVPVFDYNVTYYFTFVFGFVQKCDCFYWAMAQSAIDSLSKRIRWFIKMDFSSWMDCQTHDLEEAFNNRKQWEMGKMIKKLDKKFPLCQPVWKNVMVSCLSLMSRIGVSLGSSFRVYCRAKPCLLLSWSLKMES